MNCHRPWARFASNHLAIGSLSISVLLIAAAPIFLIFLIPLPVRAFANGEPSNLVIGQRDFTSGPGFEAECVCECSPNLTTQTALCGPFGLEFDSLGDLWVADTYNARVLEYVPPFSDGMPASIVIGQPNFTSQTSLGCAVHPTPTRLCGPVDITFDSTGSIWVADSSNNRILRYSAPFTTNESASLVIGQPNFTSNTCNRSHPTPTGLCGPYGITFDKSGDFWVADSIDDRILEFSPPFTNEMPASLVIGQPNFTSSGCNYPPTPTQNRLCRPTGLAFDSSDDLWVADSVNLRVLEYAPPFSINMTSSLVIGQLNPTPGVGCATQTRLCYPEGIAFESTDNLWVADTWDSRVLMYTLPFSNGMDAYLVIGQSNFTSSACMATRTGLCSPGDVAFDSIGNLWVADTVDSRVLRFPGSTTSTSSVTASTTSLTSSITTPTSSMTTVSGSSSGGMTQFPYQLLAASGVIVVAVTSYVFLRRGRTKRMLPTRI